MIMLINGSPKLKNSSSGQLLALFKTTWVQSMDWSDCDFNKPNSVESYFELIERADTLIFSFPLYVDGIPSHVTANLLLLEKFYAQHELKPIVFVIVNCGFFEGIQNEPAIKMMENWT